MMIIAHLITNIGTGGTENQLQQLVLASDRKRFRHIVISLTKGGLISSELKEAGIEVHSLGMRRGAWSPTGLLRLIRLLSHLKPDVLHCWLYHACLIGLLASRFVQVNRLIWALRSSNPGFRAYSLQTRATIRVCSRLSAIPDTILINSETGRIIHKQWGYRTERMRVIANGTDVDLFHPDPEARRVTREELGIPCDAVLIGLIARYHPMKDHNTFLGAAGRLYGQNRDLCFLLAGEGIMASNHALLDLIDQYGMRSAFRLLGARRDIPRLAAALDICCLSSWSESFPNVVPEAMSCGVPCVATDVGDTSHIVASTGRVVPPQDPDRLAAAIGELVAMPAEERLALGRRARERVLAQFSLQRFVVEHEKIYEQLGAGAAS